MSNKAIDPETVAPEVQAEIRAIEDKWADLIIDTVGSMKRVEVGGEFPLDEVRKAAANLEDETHEKLKFGSSGIERFHFIMAFMLTPFPLQKMALDYVRDMMKDPRALLMKMIQDIDVDTEV